MNEEENTIKTICVTGKGTLKVHPTIRIESCQYGQPSVFIGFLLAVHFIIGTLNLFAFAPVIILQKTSRRQVSTIRPPDSSDLVHCGKRGHTSRTGWSGSDSHSGSGQRIGVPDIPQQIH